MQKEEKKQEVIEAFSAMSEGVEDNPQEEIEDPNFIQDLLSLRSGEYVKIEVSEENYKKKFFLDKKTKKLEPRRCRVCGQAKNNMYGLGIFVKPEMATKIFVLYINDYTMTWKAFYLDDEDYNSRQ